jgi:hypothetical protein
MQYIAVTAALLTSFGVGAGVGATVLHFTLTAQVTCAVPLVTPADPSLQSMLKPTHIPLSGYRTY